MTLTWHHGYDPNVSLWYIQSTSGQRTYLYRHLNETNARQMAKRFNTCAGSVR